MIGARCPLLPVEGCKISTKSKKGIFQVKKQKNPHRDRLLFRLSKAEATDVAELGDPTASTTYHVCIYDESGDTPGLIAKLRIPPAGVCLNRKGDHPRPCWKKAGKKFKYRDPQRSNDGVLAMRVKAGAAGRAKVVVVARGENIPEFPMPLNVDSKVIVQVINDAPVGADLRCWGAEFREPVNKNRKDWFRDRTD